MNSIQHYLNEHDNDTANEYLSDFAGLIRMTMEHATEAFIDLDKEIKRINLYMSLEQLRFGDELKFSCVVDPSLDAGRIRIPNMVLQPYLENAIWHGIMPKNGIGEIEMHVRSMDKDHIIITVKDDGVGIFNSASIRNKNKKSALGMSLIRERMALLKKLLKQKYMVSAREITDEVTGDVKGTLVEILVPIFPKEEVLDKLETDNRMKL
jgi:LytS/YehU family sensor histidine kinase